MAQTSSISSPPGLDSGTMRAESIEAVTRHLVAEVNSRVDAKMDEVMTKGAQMMSQVRKRQQEDNEKILKELEKSLERQQVLEQQNLQLKMVVNHLCEKVAMIASVVASATPLATASTSASASGSIEASPPPTPQRCRSGSASMLGSPAPRQNSKITRDDDKDANFLPVELMPNLHGITSAPQSSSAKPSAEGSATHLCLEQALQAGSTTDIPGASLPAAGAGLHAAAAPPPGLNPVLSLATSLPPTPLTFTFTIRKADGTDLGLNVSTSEGLHNKVLIVEGIRMNGAVDAWNRMCTVSPEKSVQIGDKIICINGIAYDPDKMLQQCKEKMLLRISIHRGDGPLPEQTGQEDQGDQTPPLQARTAPQVASATLRADASEFVPGAIAAIAHSGVMGATAEAPPSVQAIPNGNGTKDEPS